MTWECRIRRTTAMQSPSMSQSFGPQRLSEGGQRQKRRRERKRRGSEPSERQRRKWTAWGAAAAAKEEAQFAEEEARWAAFKGREWALTLTLKIEKILHTGLTRRRRGRRGVGSGRRRRRRVGRERQRGRQEQMRRAWEREGWRRAELQWVQRQDARWRSKGGKGVSWRLRQRKQRQRRLATANNAMRRLPARGIGPGTGRQGRGAFAAWGWVG